MEGTIRISNGVLVGTLNPGIVLVGEFDGTTESFRELVELIDESGVLD